MNKYLRRFVIFASWLILILVTAFISGKIYYNFIDSGLILLNSEWLISYFDGLLASYLSITILFCFLFIKKIKYKYITALILTLPMLLLDLWANDGPKLVLDIINIAIFLIIGQIIVKIQNKKKRQSA